jgi:hypothetical protein
MACDTRKNPGVHINEEVADLDRIARQRLVSLANLFRDQGHANIHPHRAQGCNTLKPCKRPPYCLQACKTRAKTQWVPRVEFPILHRALPQHACHSWVNLCGCPRQRRTPNPVRLALAFLEKRGPLEVEPPQGALLHRHGLVVLSEGYVRDLFAKQLFAPDLREMATSIAEPLRND